MKSRIKFKCLNGSGEIIQLDTPVVCLTIVEEGVETIFSKLNGKWRRIKVEEIETTIASSKEVLEKLLDPTLESSSPINWNGLWFTTTGFFIYIADHRFAYLVNNATGTLIGAVSLDETGQINPRKYGNLEFRKRGEETFVENNPKLAWPVLHLNEAFK